MSKVERILRRPEVESKTGLSRSSIYEKITRSEFPAPLKLGARAVGWRESDIDKWIDQRTETT